MKKIPRACIAAVFVFVSADGFADTYIVGPGVGGGITACTHATLQEAVDAAAAHAGPDEIRMVMQSDLVNYSSQAVVISDPELTIRGGYQECSLPFASGRTILSGEGGAAAPVISIQVPCSQTGPAADIHLQGLEIVDGDNTLEGGGLYLDVCGQVAIENTRIANNQAPNGAGIYVHGHGDTATQLLFGDEVQIEDNAALGSGGGIAIESAYLQLGGTNTVVRRNATTDQGRGGGIWIQASDQTLPARAEIRSGDQGDDGVISGNLGGEGGGIFAGMYAQVRVFSTQATHPVRIERNFAQLGAGISVRGLASVEMWESVLQANHAFKAGAAVMASEGGLFSMASVSVGNAPDDTVACIPRTACNHVTDNLAVDEEVKSSAVALVSNTSTGGQTEVRFDSIDIRDNRGLNLFGDDCDSGTCETPMKIGLRGVRIDGNRLTRRIIDLSHRTSFTCDYCTIATARIFNVPEALFDSNGPVLLTRSIIWAPGRDIIGGQTPAQLQAFDLLLHDRADFPPSAFPNEANIFVRDPLFVDRAATDFHLQADSPALDIADATGAPNTDLDGNPRVVDQPDILDLSGPLDLGAYERPFIIDLIFANGFD